MDATELVTAILKHGDQALQFGGAFAGSLLGILGTVRATQHQVTRAHARLDVHDKHAGINTQNAKGTS